MTNRDIDEVMRLLGIHFDNVQTPVVEIGRASCRERV